MQEFLRLSSDYEIKSRLHGRIFAHRHQEIEAIELRDNSALNLIIFKMCIEKDGVRYHLGQKKLKKDGSIMLQRILKHIVSI